MKVSLKRILGIVFALVMCLGLFAGCTKLPKEATITTPLVVAYDPFSAKFSPFYADTAYDQDVAAMTQLVLMTTDRSGGVIYNGIKGEKHSYNGTDYTYYGPADLSVTRDEANDTTTYRAKLREDIVFSDGTKMTADDLIFTYYVYLDPAYVGSTTLGSYGIVGLKAYQANNSLAENIDGAEALNDLANNTAMQAAITDELIAPILTSELDWVKTLYGNASYKTQTEAFPIAKDLFAAFYNIDSAYDSSTVADEATVLADIIAQYGYDYEALGTGYGGSKSYFLADAQDIAFDVALASAGTGEPVPNVAGIKKIDQYTVEVTTYGYEAPAIYSILGLSIAPLNYYGDTTKYDYANNKFGHDFGDLSIVEAKTSNPVGAGAYKFVKYEDKVVYFEANPNYYKGCPKLQNIQFKEIGEADKIGSIKSGVADVSNPSGSKAKFQEIRDINSNGELDGNIIVTDSVDNLGYGYIGLNADTVLVGTDPSSTASKSLRKGLATLLSVYRDVAINSYYGDAAAVINYPISNTSWAAPQKSDADYAVAFSVDVDGKAIYTADMDAEARYAAALQAAIGYFKAAGYTWDDATSKFTAAPEGAKLVYEALIPGDGIGDHPNFQVLSNTSEALKSIGMDLEVNDLTSSAVLWDRLDAGSQEVWTAAWSATIDPDMYQVYHSSGIVGKGGSDSNHYHIADAQLDQLILDARKSSDQAYRKATYKACLDTIIDWAVEVPSYQRQNIITFSAERVNISTVTPDITTYWTWMQDIELLEVYEATAK